MRDDFIDKLLMNKWFYFIVTILFMGAFAYIFSWQHVCYWFDEDYQVDNELLGSLGDFTGGVLGTIFTMISIVLLIRTFNQQRHTTIESVKLTETQRFNDIFFELLRVYQEEVKELQIDTEESETNEKGENTNTQISCNNKDFFSQSAKFIYDKFEAKDTFEENQAAALVHYMCFYIEFHSKLSIYFRTLYRIYDLIDNAKKIDEEYKKDYLKIVRAQLTKDELFFLRYNAIGFYGHNFITYLNRYNVLKHLPILDLLEFKEWSKQIQPIERIGINIIFSFIEAMISQRLRDSNGVTQIIRLPDSDKYSIRIGIDRQSSRLTLFCFVKTTAKNESLEYSGFDSFTPQMMQTLFDCFLKEIFIYKTFKAINTFESLNFYSKCEKRKGDVDCIISGINTRNGSGLRLRSKII